MFFLDTTHTGASIPAAPDIQTAESRPVRTVKKPADAGQPAGDQRRLGLEQLRKLGLARPLDLVLHLDRHLGALSWVLSLSFAGYQFGNLPWIQRNLSAVILGIIVVSLLPAAIAYLRERRLAAAR